MIWFVGPICFLVGVIVGAAAYVRWWRWYVSKPETAQAMLKRVYRYAHPNWLQISKEDTTRVCPCCGWSEKESLAAGAATCPGNRPHEAGETS